MSLEILSGLQLPGLIELAVTQPKISIDDSRVITANGEKLMHEQFRGIFFRRFVEINAVGEGTADRQQLTYIRMVKERFGLDLLLLEAEFPSLFNEIYDAIDAKKPYDHLVFGKVALLALEQAGDVSEGSAASLDEAVKHPFGIEAIGMYYWDRLNPLLESAYSIIDARNLNAAFLAR